MQLSAYLERCDIGRSIERTVELYRDRRDAMLSSMKEHVTSYVNWKKPEVIKRMADVLRAAINE